MEGNMLQSLIIWLAVGLVAGWLASLVFKKKKSILIYILIGLVGGVIGGFLFGLLNIGISGILGDIVTAFAGSVVLLLIIRLIK
jgi:uncharacterized membrane protein YeaQ/YmgE (transglycosylase-associated protein family)